jgi:hypothetical protein
MKKCNKFKLIPGILLIMFLQLFASCSHEEVQPPVFTPIDLVAFTRDFKGFNLLGKYDVNFSNSGFSEEEFLIMKDLGFNFARIPLDYRTYTEAGNWDVFREDQVQKIDQVIEWGKQYGIHICLCLHRAPGYCVNPSALPANQDLDLWTDPSAQAAYVNHWAYFARRYKDVSWEDLSFNLVNEPKDIDEAVYAAVMKKAVSKIQSISPDRVLFVDGLNYSRILLTSLNNEKNIIQAIHVYDPMTLTHYKAEWVSGSDSWPLPVWPMSDVSQYIFGPWQGTLESSLVLNGNFKKDSTITLNVHQVSNQSTLQIKLDGAVIYSRNFVCGADLGDDWTEIVNTQWGYQNISNKDYSVVLPANGSVLTISNTAGDWITFNSLTVASGSQRALILPGNTEWGVKQGTFTLTDDGRLTDQEGNPVLALGNITNTLETSKNENIPVMIQEFGVYNKTPHPVTVSYLSDVVSLFRRYHTGYAMWNMIGSMGIINSDRTDITYESYRGKQLDRELATIVQGTGK